MGHLNSSLFQDGAFIEESIDDDLVVGHAKVEHAATIVSALVFRRFNHSVDGGLEIVSRPPLERFASIDDDATRYMRHVGPFGIVIVVSNLKRRHRLAKENRQAREVLMATKPKPSGHLLFILGVLVKVLHISKPSLVMPFITMQLDEMIFVSKLQGDCKQAKELVKNFLVGVVDEGLNLGLVRFHRLQVVLGVLVR